MIRLLFACALISTGCNAVSSGLVLTAAKLPWDKQLYGPVPCASCKEAKSDADAMADRLPVVMEKSRGLAGPDATATRTGYFSWEVSSPRGVSHCTVTARLWRCDRELTTAFTEQL